MLVLSLAIWLLSPYVSAEADAKTIVSFLRLLWYLAS